MIVDHLSRYSAWMAGPMIICETHVILIIIVKIIRILENTFVWWLIWRRIIKWLMIFFSNVSGIEKEHQTQLLRLIHHLHLQLSLAENVKKLEENPGLVVIVIDHLLRSQFHKSLHLVDIALKEKHIIMMKMVQGLWLKIPAG